MNRTHFFIIKKLCAHENPSFKSACAIMNNVLRKKLLCEENTLYLHIKRRKSVGVWCLFYVLLGSEYLDGEIVVHIQIKMTAGTKISEWLNFMASIKLTIWAMCLNALFQEVRSCINFHSAETLGIEKHPCDFNVSKLDGSIVIWIQLYLFIVVQNAQCLNLHFYSRRALIINAETFGSLTCIIVPISNAECRSKKLSPFEIEFKKFADMSAFRGKNWA